MLEQRAWGPVHLQALLPRGTNPGLSFHTYRMRMVIPPPVCWGRRHTEPQPRGLSGTGLPPPSTEAEIRSGCLGLVPLRLCRRTCSRLEQMEVQRATSWAFPFRTSLSPKFFLKGTPVLLAYRPF